MRCDASLECFGCPRLCPDRFAKRQLLFMNGFLCPSHVCVMPTVCKDDAVLRASPDALPARVVWAAAFQDVQASGFADVHTPCAALQTRWTAHGSTRCITFQSRAVCCRVPNTRVFSCHSMIAISNIDSVKNQEPASQSHRTLELISEPVLQQVKAC